MQTRIPGTIISKENYNPVVETKTYTLVSANAISKLDLPFTKETLPPGSKVIDKVQNKKFEVDEKGNWVEVGTIPKPDHAQVAEPAQANKASLFVVLMSMALSIGGTSAFLYSKKHSTGKVQP